MKSSFLFIIYSLDQTLRSPSKEIIHASKSKSNNKVIDASFYGKGLIGLKEDPRKKVYK